MTRHLVASLLLASGAMAVAIAIAFGQSASGPAVISPPATTSVASTQAMVQTPATMVSASQPATAPAAPDGTVVQGQPPASIPLHSSALPSEFSLLATRSIFLKGEPTTGPAATAPAQRQSRPEELLVFNGVMRTDGTIVAFLEDTAAAKVMRVQVGDPVGQAKITRITLDALEYEANGRMTRVQLGQTLAGSDLSAAATAPSGGPESSGGGGTNDILERMRRARQEGR